MVCSRMYRTVLTTVVWYSCCPTLTSGSTRWVYRSSSMKPHRARTVPRCLYFGASFHWCLRGKNWHAHEARVSTAKRPTICLEKFRLIRQKLLPAKVLFCVFSFKYCQLVWVSVFVRYAVLKGAILFALSLFIGSRAPLSSKRPLLSVEVSVCLSVCLSFCLVSSPVHPLPVDRFGWNLVVRTHLGSNSLLWSFSHLCPLAAELWTKNLIFRGVMPNAFSPTVLNLFFWNFGTMES